MAFPFVKRLKEESYFDYPDGENVDKKLWIALKKTGVVAFCYATIDVALYSHPKGYFQILQRYGKVCLPLLGITSVFVVVTNGATSLRKKDDHWNWLIGGAAAGIFCGAYFRRGQLGFFSSIAFSLMAGVKKAALMNNYTLLAVDNKQQNGGIRSVRMDWTLTKERPRNWTTGK